MKCNIPHRNNYCSGRFSTWLEVNLTPVCNAHCQWCVERKGWHPRHAATWKIIADAAIATGRLNIILLGGEPTLYPHLGKVVRRIGKAGRRCWVTTNGSMLSRVWVYKNMSGIFGANISIHSDCLNENQKITGLELREAGIRESIAALHDLGSVVRLNCNCIRGHIDSAERIRSYVQWARWLGADSVRFAELKFAEDDFVDLAATLNHQYGLNDNPFNDGCNSDAVIDGMPVNFRQMCGMQTKLRPCPCNPEIRSQPVLYYDGRLYDGWQERRNSDMTVEELVKLLEDVKKGNVSVAKAAVSIDRDQRGEQKRIRRKAPGGGGACVY